MTKITSVLALVGLVFSCLSLITQAEYDPPTSVGNPEFPEDLVIPPEIAVDLDKNKYAFSLCPIAVVQYKCAAAGWEFVGPLGVLVNDCKDFKEVIDHPDFVTAVSLFDTQTSSTPSGGFRSAIPSDTSSSLFRVETTVDAPNPSEDNAWLRSVAFGQTGTGAFSDVTYLQRVNTKGGIAPSPSLCNSTNNGYVYSSRFSAIILFYKKK
ncbi:1516_t:CDS:2 [Diversispora eburnea]|uniref:1516_t:CDS:1 n=1 Tax=Diversispora eburnea TaxID=1213867 RepID=A0A9N8VYF3_9GLOM|nr:1516_t:CDS:2 [Diversispora eburnea]